MDVTLQHIKDECAQDKGYEDFKDLITSCHLSQLEDVINNIAIEAQKECLQNAWDVFLNNDMGDTLDNDLIRDENNIIK